jgi:uncharacterized membrane protein YidH (DUF202 family)
MSAPTPVDRRPVRGDERTDLAWNRSGLALIGCGVVVARGFTLAALPPRQVAVGWVILVLGVLTYAIAGWHAQRRLRPGRVETPATSRDLLPVAVGIAVVGAAAFVLGALFPA